MKTTIENTNALKCASVGSISQGTLKTDDLLTAFGNELEWQIKRNGAFLSMPENFPMRDRLAKLLGESQDAWQDDGETLQDEENASELVSELQDALGEFCLPYFYFGTHPGDGSDFGFWPIEIDEIKEQVGFVSSESQDSPDADFIGEWLSVNDHGNCTLYVRNQDGSDTEIWGIV